MKIAYHLYSLKRHSNLGERHGALIRVTDGQGVGYADCHPWPEVGDLPLEEQIINLKQGKKTILMRCAIAWAQFDASARSNSQVLLAAQPRSHYLAGDWLLWTQREVETCLSKGYTHVKCKVGNDPLQEAVKLCELFSHTPLKLRLDANEKMNENLANQFLEAIQSLKNQVDFIEDLCPFDPAVWAKWQQQGWRMARDRLVSQAQNLTSSVSVLIVKPAIDDWMIFTNCDRQEIVVTSYVGHPIEQVIAAYVALQLDPNCQQLHGLMSHQMYVPNTFSLALNWDTPAFTAPSGFGCGWVKELESLDWKHI